VVFVIASMSAGVTMVTQLVVKTQRKVLAIYAFAKPMWKGQAAKLRVSSAYARAEFPDYRYLQDYVLTRYEV